MMRQISLGALAAVLFMAVATGVAVAEEGAAPLPSGADESIGADVAYYQRFEVPEAGIAVSFPPDWRVDIELERGELALDDPEAPGIEYWMVLYGEGPDGAWCDIARYLYQPAPLADQAEDLAATFREERGEDAQVSVTPVELAVGDAVRVQVDDPSEDDATSMLLFDSSSDRYYLSCRTGSLEDDAPATIARTLAWTSADQTSPAPDAIPGATPVATDEPVAPTPGPSAVATSIIVDELERIEVVEADTAVALPRGWDVAVEMTREVYQRSSDDGAAAHVTYWDVLTAESGTGDWCGLYRYDDVPMSLDEHAAELAARFEAGLGDDSTVSATLAPIGEVIGHQIDLSSTMTLEVARTYLFEVGGIRYDLTCASQRGDTSLWPAIAASVELLARAPAEPSPPGDDGEPDIPPEAVSWHSVEDYCTVVAVRDTSAADSLEASLMRADCSSAVWIQYPDGRFEERIRCALSDEPVDPPDRQGAPPTEVVHVHGGACEWTSDYWAVTDGSEIWASSYELAVTPEGEVSASAWFEPELLDCPEE
jgi:hypothetical protein